MISAIVTIILTICFLSQCYAKDAIEWFRPNFPPIYILEGEDKNNGYVDKIEREVRAFLTDYEHKFSRGNYKRIAISLKNFSNICCSCIYKTKEREEFAVYSEPVYVGFSNGVIIPRKKINQYQEFITPDHSIDLKEMLNRQKQIKIGLIKGRYYGTSCENVIAPFRKTDKIYERCSDDSLGLVSMLLKNRIDIILALPMEIAYTSKKSGLDKDCLAFFPMKDAKQYDLIYMACSGNEWGKKVIDQINIAIEQKRPVFLKYYRDWLDESAAETYDMLAKDVLDTLPAR